MRTLLLAIAICLLTALFVGNAQSQQTSYKRGLRTFSTRGAAQHRQHAFREERNESSSATLENPEIPIQMGSGLNQATVCRHDDLARDLEFQMCLHQLLNDSGSDRASPKPSSTE